MKRRYYGNLIKTELGRLCFVFIIYRGIEMTNYKALQFKVGSYLSC